MARRTKKTPVSGSVAAHGQTAASRWAPLHFAWLLVPATIASVFSSPPARASATLAPQAAGEERPPAQDEAVYQFLLGKIHRFEGDLDNAAEHLNRAADADDSAAIRAELAETYLRMGDLSKAVEQAQLAAAANPANLEARRTLVEVYLASALNGPDREGGAVSAIAEIRSILKLSPSENDLRLTLARLLLQQDRTSEALEELRLLRGSGGDPLQTGILIARALMSAGRVDEAEKELLGVLSTSPGNYDALLALSQIAEEREDWAAASGYCARLVQMRPTDNTMRSRLGYTLLRAGKVEESVQALREACSRNPSDRLAREMLVRALRAAGRPGEALHELDVLLEYRPADPMLLLQAGRLHESRSEMDLALEAYRRAAAGAEAPPAEDSEPLAENVKQQLTLAIAVLELTAEDPSAALRTLERVPRDASELGLDAAVLRSRALGAAHRPQEAVAEAQRFVDLAPDDARGPLVLLQGRLADSSRSSVEAALREFRPESRAPRALVAAAELFRSAGQGKLAVEILAQALLSHPQDASLYFSAGALQERLGNARRAEELLGRAIELDPKHDQALNYLGYLLADRDRDLPKAESLIRRALQIDPDNGAYLDSLGWALLKMGRLDEAEKALTRAGDLVAGDGAVREHIGDLYMAKKDPDRALAEWKTALGSKPEDPKRLRAKILKATHADR